MSKRKILLGVAAVFVFAGVCFSEPVIEVWPGELNFIAVEGGSNPAAQALYISNTGTGKLEWEITETSEWLSAIPKKGNCVDETDEVTVSVDISGLAIGEYNCELTISDPDASNSPHIVEVQLEVIEGEEGLWVPYDYPTIQAAIDAAMDGDTVIVADGVYTGEGNKNIDFLGKAITVKSENGAESCIIDCENLGRGFIFQSGEDAASVLDGFSVINGYRNYGGGIMCDEAGPMIKNCIIRDNYASYAGGGLFSGEGSCTINNCIIEQNTAGSGGGLIQIECGQYYIRGGGIYINGGEVIIKDSIISKNVAYFFYCEEYYTGSISEYYGMGGGIGGGYYLDTAVTINNCVIEDNWAFVGGGLSHLDGTISNCIISRNTCGDCGGGLYGCHGEIKNCIITNNIAIDDEGLSGFGGGLDDCGGTISNCTIADNFSDFYGGGLRYCDGTIINCIVWSNSPDGFYNCTADITYCCYAGATGEGNIDENPSFVDAANGDYHLRWDSPCVDAGDPAFVPEEGEVDIDGEPRVMGGRVDMGGDEVGEKQADFTRDGRIDISDLAVLSGSWGTAEGELNWYVLCDLWEDDVIDIGDLAAFVEDWMWVAEWVE